jgi:hypothetical protein
MKTIDKVLALRAGQVRPRLGRQLNSVSSSVCRTAYPFPRLPDSTCPTAPGSVSIYRSSSPGDHLRPVRDSLGSTVLERSAWLSIAHVRGRGQVLGRSNDRSDRLASQRRFRP